MIERIKAKLIRNRKVILHYYNSVFFYLTLIISSYTGFLATGVLAESSLPQNVIVFHSYHSNYEWTRQINEGIVSIFNREQNVNLFVEYMDSRRFDDRNLEEELLTLYKAKYVDRSFQAILCSDDFAFRFLLAHRDELFPAVPLVFCGVSNLRRDEIQPGMNVTGIVERTDITRSIETALQICPHPNKIYIIHNNDGFDSYYRKEISNILKDRYSVVDITGKGISELKEILGTFEEGTLGITLSAPPGWFAAMRADDRAMRECKAPLFTGWDTFIGFGILGGWTISGFKQGEFCALKVKQILRGVPADSIPVEWESPNDYIFDYLQMKRFGLKNSDVPPNSTVINRPNSFYYRYFYWILGVVVFILLQMCLVVVLVVNLLKRKKAERSLQQSEERLTLALNAANEGLWDFNPTTSEINYYSPKWYSMLGYEPYELPQVYETWYGNLHPDDVLRTEKILMDSLQMGDDYSVEYRLKTKLGEYRWILARGRIVERDRDGAPIRMVGTHVDVTERKQLEEHLRQSQKMESVGLLAGGVAHDFNNLMTAILGYSEISLLLLNDEKHPIRPKLLEIKRAGERATTLTRQLLAFSRKQILQPKLVDLNELILNMDKMLRRLIGENIEYITIPETPLPLVEADPGQIEQVLMNLAINARDALQESGKLTIETKRMRLDGEYARRCLDVEPGDYVMMAVSDDGCGMDEDLQKRIFDPFFTTKDKSKGTGLGLSMVYGIVKQSRGYVTVYSEPGCGSTFKVYLPVSDKLQPMVETSPIDGDACQGTETIMVVEDDEMVRSIITESLRSNGYTVHDFFLGSEAIQFSQNYDGVIHLLLTDVVLPQLSGRDLAEQLSLQRADMKILFMSGYTDNAVVHNGQLERGINFLQKPFSQDVLLQKVRGILDVVENRIHSLHN